MAVIGTGASAIQVVPAIQPEVGHLDVYQRSAAWVIPARRPPVHGVAAAEVPAVPRPPARPQGPALLLPRGPGPRDHPLAAAQLPCRDARPPQPRQGRRGPRPPREADPALRRLLQADPDLRRLLPRHGRRQRRRRHRPDRAHHADRRGDRRRHRAARRRDRRGDRVPRDRPTGVAPDPRPRRPDAGRDLGWGRHDDVQGHDVPRLPQPLRGAGRQHRPGPHVGDRLHRGA